MSITEARSQIAGDRFLERAVRDLMKRGANELDAITIVLNTYAD